MTDKKNSKTHILRYIILLVLASIFGASAQQNSTSGKDAAYEAGNTALIVAADIVAIVLVALLFRDIVRAFRKRNSKTAI